MSNEATPLARWTVPAVAVVVLAISGGVLAVLRQSVDGLVFAAADKKATALLDMVKVAASLAVGGGGLFALYLAARGQRTQELKLALRPLAVTEEIRRWVHELL
ncbi:hypothetical protein [Lentzea aerocolonigenes]|uniref:hypothetical protein n=1 Tax=Lentzea aerocolonigenes TaxID=68170 RepID=UPI000AE0357F|nr:hypothetical protein [Lentzea aerocolonigenes]MCP2242707.1 hypothetical protein [Lentzea aerocolonigenes]